MVVTIDKELQVSDQSVHLSGKAPGLASQAFQVMPQIGIHRFHRIGFLFVRSHFIGSTIIQGVVDRKCIAVILFGLRRTLQTGLQRFAGSLCDYIPAQDATRVPIHYGEDVDFVFFCPTKVYNSSNSAFLTFAGSGAGGKAAVWFRTQFATLCGLTFKILAIAP